MPRETFAELCNRHYCFTLSEKYSKFSQAQKELHQSSFNVLKAQWWVTSTLETMTEQYNIASIPGVRLAPEGLIMLQETLKVKRQELHQTQLAYLNLHIKHKANATTIAELHELMAVNSSELDKLTKTSDCLTITSQTAAAPAVTSDSSQQASASSVTMATATFPTLTWSSMSTLSIFHATGAASTSMNSSKDYKSANP